MGGDGVAFDACAVGQGHAVAQRGQRMTFLGRLPVEVGGADGIGGGRTQALLHGAAQDIKRVRIAIDRRLLEPGARLDEVAGHALAAQVERPEIELSALVALFRGPREQFDGARVVARCPAIALGEDQGQPVRALGRTGVGGLLDQPQALALEASLEQDRPQPCSGVGICRRQRSQRRFSGGKIAGPVRSHRCAQGGRDIAGIV